MEIRFYRQFSYRSSHRIESGFREYNEKRSEALHQTHNGLHLESIVH